jgi:hypothetical protein
MDVRLWFRRMGMYVILSLGVIRRLMKPRHPV